jgi:hypothetical protein
MEGPATAAAQTDGEGATDVTARTATLKTLQTASKGLLFPSESDRPVKAFTWTPDQAKGASSAAAAVAAVKGVDPDSIRSVSLDDLFKPVMTPQSWQGDDEKAVVQGFQALKRVLTETLTDPTVYRVEGGTTIDVYVIGKDPDGNWSGVSTQLVET